jgi:hypothetical protein
MKHDTDAIYRFINAAWNRDDINPDDAEVVALLLMDAIQQSSEVRRILGIRRGRGPKHDMNQVYLDHPVFGIAMKLADGDLERPEAIEAVCQHYDDIDEKTASNYLDLLEARATSTARTLRRLSARAIKSEK